MKKREIIVFKKDKVQFNYRVAGVAFNGNQVLLHKAENDNFWTLPGGRVELLEPSKDALKREMQEELGIDARVGRLIWVVETFFKEGETLFHELGLYYLMELPKDCFLYRKRQFLGKENLGEGKEIQLIFSGFFLMILKLSRFIHGFCGKL